LNPYNAEPEYNQGVILGGLRRRQEAEEKFKMAIEKNPLSQPKYYQVLAEMHLRNGEIESAEAVLEKAVNYAFPMNESYQGFAFIYIFTGFDKELTKTYLLYAQVLSMQGKFEQAQDVVNSALTHLDPENPELLKLQSFLKTELSQP